ncbi:MAG: hypothetical protein ABFD89_05865 [Bryobacteraceae bacterium]
MRYDETLRLTKIGIDFACEIKDQRIAALEAQVAELTAALNDAYSRCPQLVTDASNSGDNRPRAAIDAARKAGA